MDALLSVSTTLLPSELVMTTSATELFWNHSSSTVDYVENPLEITCPESGVDCVIDHSIQCVGDPAYCNLTESEYIKLLHDYIYPTIPEWILICSHFVVFLMGLVSIKNTHNLIQLQILQESLWLWCPNFIHFHQ